MPAMTRTLLALSMLTLAGPALAGEPVVFPDITPGTTSEFALAFMLQEKVQEALQAEGHVVLTQAAVEPVVGDAMNACADVPGCPFAPLQQLPANLAVVVRIVREGEGLYGEVSVFNSADTAAIETRNILIEPGQEDSFATEVAHLTTDILTLQQPSNAEDIVEAVKLVETARWAGVAEEAEATTTVTPPPAPPPADPVAEPILVDATLEEILEDTGVRPRHLAGSRAHFENTELDPRDWLYKSTPHAGRVVIEVRGGIGLGDVDRAADVRVVTDADGSPTSEWFQEGPQYAQRVRGGLYVGYAPATWVDLGVLVGLQYGQKYLTTGYTWGENPQVVGAADPSQAVQFHIQPRVRFYLAPVGVVKPFVLVAPELRLFDSYHIIDPETIDYPDPYGGIMAGATGGGGLIVDPSPLVGFFAEGTYTQHFGTRAAAAQLGETPSDKPAAPEGRQYTIGIVGGVQFRI